MERDRLFEAKISEFFKRDKVFSDSFCDWSPAFGDLARMPSPENGADDVFTHWLNRDYGWPFNYRNS